MSYTLMRYTPMRCTPVRCTPREMHAHEVYACEVWPMRCTPERFGENLQIFHLTNGGAVVDLSRSELQNTSFCAKG